jgi:hypothetical protein
MVDCMGHNSPVVQQLRWGQKPDGVCLTVGSCSRGFTDNTTSDGTPLPARAGALSVTQRALGVTQRELLASPSESSWRHPARALGVTQRELLPSPSESSWRHPARALTVTQRELLASPSEGS